MYIYIYIYTYICLYIYIYKHIYIYNIHISEMGANNVPSRLSPQWLRGNSCTWAHDVWFDVYHVPKCMRCHKTIVVITGRAHCFQDLHIN